MAYLPAISHITSGRISRRSVHVHCTGRSARLLQLGPKRANKRTDHVISHTLPQLNGRLNYPLRLTRRSSSKVSLRHDIPALGGLGKVVVLEPGEALFKAGDPIRDMYYVADGLRRAERTAQGGKPKRLGYFERDMTVNAESQMPPQAVSKGVETLIDLKVLKKIGPNRVVLLDRPELEILPHQSAGRVRRCQTLSSRWSPSNP